MATNVACRCGWRGTVDPAPEGGTVRCPACGSSASVVDQTENVVDKTAAASGDGLPNVPVSATGSWAKSFRSAAAAVWRFIRPAWNFTRCAFGFYRANWDKLRAGARLWLIDYLPALQDPELLRREIRRPLADDDELRSIDGVWHLRLPERCVVCGGEARGDWLEEERAVLDPSSLISAPLAGLVAGVILTWWYESISLLLIFPFVGVLVGYALRREERFLLKLKRCAKHVDRRSIPELAVIRRQMVLRPGTREVKLAFLREPAEYEHVIPQPTPAAPDEPALPETIPLADDVPESSAIIMEKREDRLPAADDESEDDDAPPII